MISAEDLRDMLVEAKEMGQEICGMVEAERVRWKDVREDGDEDGD